ncbi:hypothetical protein G7046_g8428 [Stylonectria norvegica]|nr:hypothetical protein G7046_g8428 [Stylonectria norvegica]
MLSLTPQNLLQSSKPPISRPLAEPLALAPRTPSGSSGYRLHARYFRLTLLGRDQPLATTSGLQASWLLDSAQGSDSQVGCLIKYTPRGFVAAANLVSSRRRRPAGTLGEAEWIYEGRGASTGWGSDKRRHEMLASLLAASNGASPRGAEPVFRLHGDGPYLLAAVPSYLFRRPRVFRTVVLSFDLISRASGTALVSKMTDKQNFGSGAAGVSRVSEIIIIVFLSISLYNVIELTFIIWGTFKRYSGLYFWSFLCAVWGIPLHNAGFLTKYYSSASLGYLAGALISVGWVAMVTGQSLVLWSRLHLVLRNRSKLRAILCMIIIDAVVCHGATIPMIFGSFSPNPEPWAKPYSVMEKIQVSVFFIQETIISGFYIFETVKLMKMEQTMGNRKSSRQLMNHLVVVNIIIILLDMTILGLEYANQYEYQTAYKSLVYSAKLKLEFAILNRLVEMTTGNKDLSSGVRSRTGNARTNNRTGIALDTFPSHAEGVKVNDFSCEAYAMGTEDGSSDGRGPGKTGRGRGVMMTTEITVQREDRQDDDNASFDGKSSAESTTGRKIVDTEGGALSKSSSEVHLAPRGY